MIQWAINKITDNYDFVGLFKQDLNQIDVYMIISGCDHNKIYKQFKLNGSHDNDDEIIEYLMNKYGNRFNRWSDKLSGCVESIVSDLPDFKYSV